MTPAAELHAAAAKLRQDAEIVGSGRYSVILEHLRRLGTYWEPEAVYLEDVHPGVGLLLADLLDRAAKRAEVYETAIDEIAVEPHLAVARVILGDTDQPDAGRSA
jgi:hypothetical protein